MSTATSILKDEHKVILEALFIVKKLLKNPNKEVEKKIIDFIKNFADACHHGKEEKILYNALENNPKVSAPISMMLNEHKLGREFVKNKDLASYENLLSQHIEKENNILYPIIDQILKQKEQEDFAKKFEKFEKEEIGKGIHEKYQKMIEELKKKKI